MKKKILGISGKRFSGKDTLAALLIAKAKDAGIDLRAHAFATESKRMFAAAQNESGVVAVVDADRLVTDRAYKEEWRPKLTEFTVRSIEADPLVFCRSVADRIEKSDDHRAALITDVRLRLELDHLRPRFDLHLLRITRSDDARRSSGWAHSPSVDGHHTETELDDPSLWDEIVDNDGSIDALGERAEAIIRAAQLLVVGS